MSIKLFRDIHNSGLEDSRLPKIGGARPGFTIIELMVVVGLMGILFAILIMSNTRMNNTYQLRSDMRQLTAAAKQATQLARASLAKTRVMVFEENGGFAMQIEKQITDAKGGTTWSCHAGSYYRFYRGVEIKFVKASESYAANTKSCGSGQSITGARAVDMLSAARGVQYAEVEMTAPNNPVWVINPSGVKITMKN